MKKYLLGFLLVASLVVLPSVSQAAEDLTVTLYGSGLTKGVVGEPVVQTSFSVMVTPNNGDVYLYTGGILGIQLIQDGGRPMPDNCTYSQSLTGTLPIVTHPLGSQYYKLARGTTARFNASVYCKISQMHPGTYYGKLSHVTYSKTDPTTTNSWYDQNIENIRTPASINMYVLGETGPWISLAVAKAVQGGYEIVLTGERLGQVRSVFLNNKTYTPSAKPGDSVSFFASIADLPAGNYPSYANFSGGKSNNFYLMVGGSSIGIISPNGGENLNEGFDYPIRWTNYNITSPTVNVGIERYDSSGASQGSTNIITVPTTQNNSYLWRVNPNLAWQGTPVNPSSGPFKYKIYVNTPVGVSPVVSDYSDNYFTIAALNPTAKVAVTSPKGGESLAQGSTYNITWNAASTVTKVAISLLKGDIVRSTSIINPVSASAGTYAWKVGNTAAGMMEPGTDYRIKVYGVTDAGVPIADANSTSNYFSIVVSAPATAPTINSITPNTAPIGTASRVIIRGLNFSIGDTVYRFDGEIQSQPFCTIGVNANGNYDCLPAKLPAGAYKLAVVNSRGTSNKVDFTFTPATAIPTLSVSLDPSNPTRQNIGAGSIDQVFVRIKVTAGSMDVNNLQGIQLGSDSANANDFITNIKVFDGANQLGGTISGLDNNGKIFYKWTYPTGVMIPAGTSKILTIVAEVKSTASSNSNFRLGITGWNFVFPGTAVEPFGTPIYGNYMTITALTDQPTITAVAMALPNCSLGAINCTWQAGTDGYYLWGYLNPNTPTGNTVSVSLCAPDGITCTIAKDASLKDLNKVPSKTGTGLGNLNSDKAPLGRGVLTNPDLVGGKNPVIVNNQSTLKICPTNADGSPVTSGICKVSPVFTITPPATASNSLVSRQLASIITVLSDLLAKIRGLAW